MLRYALHRVAMLVPIWFAVAVLVFSLVRLVPGDPAMLIAGTEATPEAVDKIRADLGLDRPPLEQFVHWFGRVIQGDLGRSFVSKEDIASTLRQRAPVSFELALTATVFSVIIAVPAGVVAAVRRKSVWDWLVNLFVLSGICIPSFVMGLLLMYWVAIGTGLFPLRGYVALAENPLEWARHIALPALSYGLIQAASVARMTRSSVLEVLGQDYVRTARAKGLAELVVLFKHALRNALIPVVTVIGINIGILFTGAVVIETLFSLPGVGSYLVLAIRARDYPAVQGTILFVATVMVLINLLVDLAYSVLDPRIRYE